MRKQLPMATRRLGGGANAQAPPTPKLMEARALVLKKLYDLQKARSEESEDIAVPTPPPPPQPKDFEKETFEGWLGVTEVLYGVKESLDSMRGPMASVVRKGLAALEDHMTRLACVHYAAVGEVEALGKKVGSMESDIDDIKKVLNINKAQGAIDKPYEQSPHYITHCNKVAVCDTQVKLPGLDLGVEIKEGHDQKDLMVKVRAKLAEQGNGVELKDDQKVTLLKKATKFNTKSKRHTIPVLIHAKSRDNRIKMEHSIKAAKKLTASYHWPKEVSDKVKVMREQLEKYEEKENGIVKFSLQGKQIRIRPTEDGRFLVIHYRDGVGCPWISLDSVRTPISEKMAADAKTSQPCKSKYFSF